MFTVASTGPAAPLFPTIVELKTSSLAWSTAWSDVESVAVVRCTEVFMVLNSSWFISKFHFANLLGHSFGNIWLRLEL